MRLVRPLHLFVALAVLSASVLSACSKSVTAPRERAPQGAVHRTVSVALTDSLGQPLENTQVLWIAQFESAGIVPTVQVPTNAQGIASAVLAEGAWRVTAFDGTRIGGASFPVSGSERAPADTQLVRLVAHTKSRANGIVHLVGQSNHEYTVVALDGGGVDVTDSSGAFSFDMLPLGHWTLTFSHVGYQPVAVRVDVPAPGTTLELPIVFLKH